MLKHNQPWNPPGVQATNTSIKLTLKEYLITIVRRQTTLATPSGSPVRPLSQLVILRHLHMPHQSM